MGSFPFAAACMATVVGKKSCAAAPPKLQKGLRLIQKAPFKISLEFHSSFSRHGRADASIALLMA